MPIDIDQINVSQRLRGIDNSKVDDLVESMRVLVISRTFKFGHNVR